MNLLGGTGKGKLLSKQKNDFGYESYGGPPRWT